MPTTEPDKRRLDDDDACFRTIATFARTPLDQTPVTQPKRMVSIRFEPLPHKINKLVASLLKSLGTRRFDQTARSRIDPRCRRTRYNRFSILINGFEREIDKRLPPLFPNGRNCGPGRQCVARPDLIGEADTVFL